MFSLIDSSLIFFLISMVKNPIKLLSIIKETQAEESDKFFKILSPTLVSFSLANFLRVSKISKIIKFFGSSTYLTNSYSKDKIQRHNNK